MPLSKIVAEHVATLEGFIASPDARILCITVEPDLERMVIRILGARSEQGKEIFLGVSATFSNAEQFYDALEKAVLDNVEEGMGQLAEDGVSLANVERMDREYGAPGVGSEVRFVSFMEGVARSLRGHATTVVLVLSVEQVHDEKALLATLRVLGQATLSPQVKYIFLDQGKRSTLTALDGLRATTHRMNGVVIGADATDVNRRFFSDPRRRVFVENAARATPAAPQHDARAVSTEEALRTAGFEDVWEQMPIQLLEVEAFFRTETAFFGEGIAALRKLAKQKGIAEEDVALSPETSGWPVLASFAWMAEKVGRNLPERATLVVVLRPLFAPKLAAATLKWAVRALMGALVSLSAAAISPRVRYVVVNGNLPPIAEVATTSILPVIGLKLPFVLPMDRIEQGLAEHAEGDHGNALLRVRSLSMLAGLATTRKDFKQALARSQEAVLASRTLGSGEEEALAFLGRGHVFYRMGEYGFARDGYVQAAALSQGQKNHVLAGQSLVSLGHTYYCEKNYTEALRCYGASQKHYETAGNSFGVCHTLVWSAESQRGLDDRAQAILLLKEALLRYEGMGPECAGPMNQGRLDVLSRLGRVYRENNQNTEAEAVGKQVEALGGAPPINTIP